MTDSLALLDFFNSREKAILFWTVVLVAIVIVKANRDLGESFLAVLRAFAKPKLLLLFGSAALYCAAITFLAKEAGLWHTTALKETAYWFLASGVVLVGNATQADPDDPDYYRDLLRKAVRYTILVEFLVNLYVFPLGVELVLVPILFMFFAMQLVVTHDRGNAEKALPIIDGVLVVVGVLLLAYVAVSAVADLGGLLTRENAEKLLLPVALTLALVPLLHMVARVSQWELAKLRKSLRTG
jgi:hypothetical protein